MAKVITINHNANQNSTSIRTDEFRAISNLYVVRSGEKSAKWQDLVVIRFDIEA